MIAVTVIVSIVLWLWMSAVIGCPSVKRSWFLRHCSDAHPLRPSAAMGGSPSETRGGWRRPCASWSPRSLPRPTDPQNQYLDQTAFYGSYVPGRPSTGRLSITLSTRPKSLAVSAVKNVSRSITSSIFLSG
jgi:hypothetical protein